MQKRPIWGVPVSARKVPTRATIESHRGILCGDRTHGYTFLPFPAEFVAIANGMVHGAFWGTVITWAGAMLGAFLSFGLTRLVN